MEILFALPAAFFAPAIHEYTKTITSTAQGDPTPRNRGFLTLNPLKFFEPIGFLLMLFFGGLGWGQPVPTGSLHYKNRARATLITYATPIVVNLLVGIASIVALSLWARGNVIPGVPMASVDQFLLTRVYFIRNFEFDPAMIGKTILFAFAQMNILLALFNLIPVHPLSMSKIVQIYVRPDTRVKLNHYEKPMQIVLILAMVLRLVGTIFYPVWSALLRAFWVF